jgi:hypothetical protein
MSGTVSIVALREIKHLISDNLNKTLGKTKYDIANELQKERNKIIKEVSVEIEKYVVDHYKKYGIISVPICHRSGTNGDRLMVELKMKKFPGLSEMEKKYKEAERAYEKGLKDIENWNLSALKCVAQQSDLPEPPTW